MFDGLKRKIALHELKAWINDARDGKEGGGMKKFLTALEGYKLIIGVVALFVVGVYDQKHGGHATDTVTAVLQTLGWMPTGDWSGDAIAKASSSAFVLLGLAGKLYKAWRQVRAGSSIAGALSTEGYVIRHEVDVAAGKPAALAVDMKAAVAVQAANELKS